MGHTTGRLNLRLTKRLKRRRIESMSYLGSKRIQRATYRSRYVVGIGDMPSANGVACQTFDVYECDHCETVAQCLRLEGQAPATEPFYCQQCNQLVSV
jgi:hypothetical protein